MKRVCLILTIVFAVLSVALLAADLPAWQKYRKGDIKDFNTVAAGELKEGDLVKGYIEVTEGSIAERQETKKHFGITTSKSTTMQYYAVYMDNGQCILYGTSKSDEYAQLDKLGRDWTYFFKMMDVNPEELTESDRPTARIPFTARVNKMSKDLNSIFSSWWGENYNTECETNVIMTYARFEGFQTTVFIGFGLAAGAVLMLILFIVTVIKGKKAPQYTY
ncbi:MAG: hypothetical protein IKI58_03065 [Oscillospiraceae bacterium]|nr:hypothetical protein [Oscillospiraceae bacterium]